MKLVAGLGNPGRGYERTPHNAGFRVLDLLAGRLRAEWKNVRAFNAALARAPLENGEPLLLAKPLTYMNRSGGAIASLLRYHNGETGDLLVILDDANLPPGRIRVRADGSAGGHNGLDDIIQCLGSGLFPRIRLGVGRGAPGEDLANHVLGMMPPGDQAALDAALPVAADAALELLRNGLTQDLLTRFNGWLPPTPGNTP
ncbi:MAG: aminoacyl-tRNA hydrolase [Kiritimatiellaeota bacterium]|nr:aminoacyl-tRNA hydrolase [Kiritimatiellota bacterium]